MARRKIIIELGVVEAQHLQSAVAAAQLAHKQQLGRESKPLTQVERKLDEALAAKDEPTKQVEQTEPTSGEADA